MKHQQYPDERISRPKHTKVPRGDSGRLIQLGDFLTWSRSLSTTVTNNNFVCINQFCRVVCVKKRYCNTMTPVQGMYYEYNFYITVYMC